MWQLGKSDSPPSPEFLLLFVVIAVGFLETFLNQFGKVLFFVYVATKISAQLSQFSSFQSLSRVWLFAIPP